MTTETKTLSKNEIVSKIVEDPNFKAILKTYRTNMTGGFKIEFTNEYKNGLVEVMYGITIKDKLISILMPIFSSEKTVTWNFSYLKTLKSILPAEYNSMEDHELVSLIKCPLYYFDKFTGEVIFLSLVGLKDWIDNGAKGKNGYSVYFWNDKLPNQYAVTKKELHGEVFVHSLPLYSNKELKSLCIEYATKFHKRFADITKRTEQTKIKNIANGLYAQIKVYLWLKNEGYDVTMEWLDGDDLGIDIVYHVNGAHINIDVKSTNTEYLKISKNRKETDFYAVCTWSKGEPQLLGFLFKYNFWRSDIIDTDMPEKKNDMYVKKIDKKFMKNVVTIDKTFDIHNNYRLLRMKRGERLFNQE